MKTLKGGKDLSAVNVTIKTFVNGRQVGYQRVGTIKRFLRKIRTATYDKIAIKATYGVGKNNYGEKTTFTNEGEYTNKKDAEHAFIAFVE